MLFNSGEFLIFLTVVWVLHWWIVPRSERWQNALLLAASLVFYALSDLQFLALLLASSLINHALALHLVRLPEGRARSTWFWLGVSFNLGLLIYFKYANFFVEAMAQMFASMGLASGGFVLAVLLPLGISFYTFQMLGYLINVQHEEIDPCKNRLNFLTYVFFFPKILAGPIERAQHFLPQIEVPRVLDPELISDGLRQILWGLFAKVVIADELGPYIDTVFGAPDAHGSGTILGAVMLYIVQIYCDFSGYSNIALGVAKLFGIRLVINFAYPLFAVDISDFWRKWHVSLTSWMIDHVFTPLSFILRDMGKRGLVIAISVTFFCVGIWHGANWTYVVFGILQSIYFIPLAVGAGIGRASVNSSTALLPAPGRALRMLGMFVLMSFTFALLRAGSLGSMANIYQSMVINFPLNSGKQWSTMPLARDLILYIIVLLCVEWIQRGKEHGLVWERLRVPKLVRFAVYLVIAQLVIWKSGMGNNFIYFQF